jgi:outer membrane protein OmpA-like peptidoglycan-associated protein
MNTRYSSILVPLFSGILLVGCASALPPKELLDARAAFNQASARPGASLAPVPLHEAQLALNSAEQSFGDDPTSVKTRDLSYVADRKAKLAEVQGETAMAAAAGGQARAETSTLQAQQLTAAQKGLQATQGALTATQNQLSMTGEQLTAETAARKAAEKRARDAMDKLGVAAALAVKEEPRGTVIVMPGSVLFASNKSELLPGAREKLNAVAQALKNQDDRKILVEGHTDSQGTEASNLELGQRRAQSVRDYLVSQGVSNDAISATGIGQSRPVADNKSPEGRADNRRVEIVVKAIEKR